MSWTNYHCHTQFCDGKADIEAFVEQAIAIGMPVLGFSAHGPVPYASGWNMKKEDLPAYFEMLEKYKIKYADSITLFTGMEVDFIKGKCNARDEIFQHEALDFKIGSIHYLGNLNDGTPWTLDGSRQEWEKGMNEIFGGDVFNIVKTFTQQSIEMIELGGFDIVGHIDKTFQHGFRYFNADHPKFIRYTLEILEAAKTHNKIVEINTKSFERMGFFYPNQIFFKRIKEMNIPITINSDTHHPLLLTAGIQKAAKLLLEVGINETYEFINREWIPCKLTEKGILLS